ncbi:Laminin subunit alpha [Hondaea fermentalgiana]|uniref:Laminin subunit alpha n=1 Tax=Hondaea fermentalgiana TaxID=2315210 RepID=A0A2R5GTS9_9STRA|nr:Laminin subunit alpha [Hondaea fermentalgiana]|eukprot:GBG33158.1 Laminin subunit alpha [Hondaea fermentalgiana]
MAPKMLAILATALLAGSVRADANVQVAPDFASGVTVSMEGAAANGNVCLSLMADQTNLELRPEPCLSSSADQVWYYTTSNQLMVKDLDLTDASTNAGAVQVQTHATPTTGTTIQFLGNGKMMNAKTQLCLAPGYLSPGAQGTQFLKYTDCGAAPTWHLRRANLPRGGAGASPSTPRVESVPQVSSTPQVPVAPRVPQGATPYVPSQQTAPSAPQVQFASPQVVDNTQKGVVQYKADLANSRLSEKDHYLCICVVDADEDKCVRAVSAACTVGHIPSELCKQSFEDGDHDEIAKSIVGLIERGERCSSMSADEVREEFAESKLPVQALHGQQVVTSEDHYLCVCLSNGGDVNKLDKQCEDAVRVACMVGHIPETECFESFDEQNHAQIAERIMRMIDRGANCAQKLQVHPSDTCPKPPCYSSQRHSRHEPTRADHYLCPCMDDHRSELCIEGVKRACKLGHIPKTDCELAHQADYRQSVTRHVLHLIDHGAECGLADSMTFTNRGCHCKNSWTAQNGEIMTLPNNCNDPGGERGFDWCETFPEEGCIGVGDSMSWDRCDAPMKPRYHPGQFISTPAGRVSPVDHYLCVCVDKSGTDEGCVAAVKAGCHVGHIPSEACASSFENADHAEISEHVISIIANGARCNNVDLSVVTSASQVPQNRISGGCGHGSPGANGECSCRLGFAGARCNYCAQGYVGYPSCVPKRDCDPACHYGTCDFTSGTCTCPTNRAGDQCETCASGYSGANCTPSGLFGAGPFATLFMLAACAGAAYMCCCTPMGAQFMSAMPGAPSTPGGNYSRLSNHDDDDDGRGDYFGTVDGDDDHVLEVEATTTSADELTGIGTSAPGAAPLRPAHTHSGLAI